MLQLIKDWPVTPDSTSNADCYFLYETCLDYVQYLHKIVSVGRIKWFGNMTGKDNCAWYLFDYNATRNAPLFYGRV